MPFTYLSHQAVGLPFGFLRRRRPDMVALVVGSAAPDLAYALAGTPWHVDAHAPAGMLWFATPLAVLLAWATRRAVARPLARHLPARLGLRRFAAVAEHRPPLLVTAASAFAGIASHVLWDSFTHRSGHVVAALPALRRNAAPMVGLDLPWHVPVYQVLQHGSTVAGALCALMLIAALRRRLPAPDLPAATAASAAVFWGATACGGVAGLGAAALAHDQGGLLAVGTIRATVGLYLGMLIGSLCLRNRGARPTSPSADGAPAPASRVVW